MFALPRTFAALLFTSAIAILAATPLVGVADGPGDNIPDKVRPVPPVGNDIPAEDLAKVKEGLAELQQFIKDCGKHELLPDVLIYEKAVRWALDYKEIYDPPPPKDKKLPLPTPAGNVKKVLAAGLERAKALKEGKTPWTTQTGGVLRGYKSKIDGSVQPYWMIVPKDYDFAGKTKHRLDFWWHGRYENTVEAGFMANSPGSGGGIIPAPGALILHPFGRFSNANKFAGEVDTFECLDHAKKHYRIDESRLVARGFSMGGAACWQYGAHYPTLWAACAPGAGFSETPEFLKEFQKEDTSNAPWYEKKLWHTYNASDHAQNFFNLPTVAYSGEVDSQKQAADVMAREFKKVGLELKHVIGPKTGHTYEKDAKIEVNKLIDEIVEKGKPEMSAEIKFVTYTLRYNRCGWVTVTGIEKHWQKTQVEGKYQHKDRKYSLKTAGVTEFTLAYNVLFGGTAIDGRDVSVIIDSDGFNVPYEKLPVPGTGLTFHKTNGAWHQGPSSNASEKGKLRKRHGLQGPIDDAFMDSFLMVKPTGKPLTETGGKWVETEMKHATDHWRKQFRGDAPVKSDSEITDEDIKNNNLILWGDPQSNAVLAKIVAKLPIKWDSKIIIMGTERQTLHYFDFGGKAYPSDTHAPVLIYPNPLNPSKYVVLNSGFTYREYDYLNNARQTPKLPDYAIIDITTPPNSRYPGKVIRGGFFGENWELLKDDGK